MKNFNLISRFPRTLGVLGTALITVATSICANGSTDGMPNSAVDVHNWKDASAAQMLELPAFRAEQRLQNILADCMTKSGHDYQAYVPVSSFPSLFPTNEKSVLSALNSNLKHNSSDNPNDRHYEGLSREGQARYADALWNRDTGCATLAFERTHAAHKAVLGEPRVEAFEEALNQINKQLRSSNVYQKAINRWSNCATVATGLDLKDPTDVHAYVFDDLNRSFNNDEGLVLNELLNAPATGSTKVDQGVLNAALAAARTVEGNLNKSTQACDQAFSDSIETTHRKIVNQTFEQFDDVIKVLMNN